MLTWLMFPSNHRSSIGQCFISFNRKQKKRTSCANEKKNFSNGTKKSRAKYKNQFGVVDRFLIDLLLIEYDLVNIIVGLGKMNSQTIFDKILKIVVIFLIFIRQNNGMHICSFSLIKEKAMMNLS